MSLATNVLGVAILLLPLAALAEEHTLAPPAPPLPDPCTLAPTLPFCR